MENYISEQEQNTKGRTDFNTDHTTTPEKIYILTWMLQYTFKKL